MSSNQGDTEEFAAEGKRKTHISYSATCTNQAILSRAYEDQSSHIDKSGPKRAYDSSSTPNHKPLMVAGSLESQIELLNRFKAINSTKKVSAINKLELDTFKDVQTRRISLNPIIRANATKSKNNKVLTVHITSQGDVRKGKTVYTEVIFVIDLIKLGYTEWMQLLEILLKALSLFLQTNQLNLPLYQPQRAPKENVPTRKIYSLLVHALSTTPCRWELNQFNTCLFETPNTASSTSMGVIKYVLFAPLI
ncbi:hypothetical protein LXL04_016466 [Taraxacum kok-saghyz]